MSDWEVDMFKSVFLSNSDEKIELNKREMVISYDWNFTQNGIIDVTVITYKQPVVSI